jgi:hypothetical protein
VEGNSRRRLSGVAGAIALALGCGWPIARASVGPAEQRGVFALLGGTPKIVSQLSAGHGAGSTYNLKIRQFQPDAKTPVLKYAVDMKMLMHLIVVRDDFGTFAHLHPTFHAKDGTFSQVFAKAPNHRYFVYADTTPQGIGQQVFRFTLESDRPTMALRIPSAPSPATASAAPYTLTLSRTTLAQNQPALLNVTVLKGGRPASDLTPYLGAAAHAVFINTSTLVYVHLHPVVHGATMAMNPNMQMTGVAQAAAGPHMQMSVPALPMGTYRLWIQFRGANATIYTAPFTILVR